MLHSLVQEANHSNPASAADRQMLYAIPVNELPARHPPVGQERVAELCQGTVDSAERVRHLAWTTAPDAAWSPQLSADSLRETAGCATAISHHSAVLLRSLADRAMEQGSTLLSDQLADSAAQAAEPPPALPACRADRGEGAPRPARPAAGRTRARGPALVDRPTRVRGPRLESQPRPTPPPPLAAVARARAVSPCRG